MALPERGTNATRRATAAGVVVGSADTIGAFLAEVRERAQCAVYPELFEEGLLPPSAILQRTDRPANGMRTLVLRHGSLDEAQRDALARFRLDQFLLCEWYDAGRIHACRAEVDPAFDALSDETMHVCVGNARHQLLAYACVGSAAHQLRAELRSASWAREGTMAHDPTLVHLGTPGRLLLPTEADLYGTRVYSTIPAIAPLPLDAVVEHRCLISNRAIVSVLASAAALETIFQPVTVLFQSARTHHVIIGQAEISSRKLMRLVGYPVIYAPTVPAMPYRDEFYWHDDMNQEGRFWPYAVPLDDWRVWLRANEERLSHALSLPATDLRRALALLLRDPRPTPPTTLLPGIEESSLFWTTDGLASNVPDAVTAQPARHAAR